MLAINDFIIMIIIVVISQAVGFYGRPSRAGRDFFLVFIFPGRGRYERARDRKERELWPRRRRICVPRANFITKPNFLPVYLSTYLYYVNTSCVAIVLVEIREVLYVSRVENVFVFSWVFFWFFFSKEFSVFFCRPADIKLLYHSVYTPEKRAYGSGGVNDKSERDENLLSWH